MAIPPFLKTIAQAPYYRKNWHDAVREVPAAVQFKRHRIQDPATFLKELDIDPAVAFAGFESWRLVLENAIRRVAAAEGHQGACSMEDGMILYGLCRALKPQVVIETGVAAGISTSFIGAAMAENGAGMHYSIELPPSDVNPNRKRHEDGGEFAWPKGGVGWAIPDQVRASLAERHRLILEDVRIALPRLLDRVGPVDLFFHDDLHTPAQMRWQFRLVWPRIAPGGVLAADDANIGWIDFCREFGLSRRMFSNVQRLTAVRKPPATTAVVQ